jgi:CRP-like cAMP-binding protein
VLRKGAKVDLLQRVPLFSQCNKKQLASIAQLGDIVAVPAGTDVIREGEVGYEFLIFVEGAGVVSRKGRKIDTIGPGDFVGEMALLTQAPRNASVKTTSATTLLALHSREFRSLLGESPDIQRKILDAVVERLPPQAV